MISAIGRFVSGGLERTGYATRSFGRVVLEIFSLLRRPRLVTT
ncbi:ABC transporter permease, partial [Burkholderia pseudomallei]